MGIRLKKYFNILSALKTTGSGEYNFISLHNGKYKLTRNWFKKVFLKSYCKFSDGGHAIVFKSTPHKLGPIFIDIDLNLTEYTPSHKLNDCYSQLIEVILGIFSENFPQEEFVQVVATKRPGIYKKKDHFRAGFHLIILGKYNLNTSQLLREKVLQCFDLKSHFEEFLGKIVCNTSEDIYDPALSERRNGTLLIGCNKPNMKVGPHYIFLYGQWRNGWNDGPKKLSYGWEFANIQMKKTYESIMFQIYKFIWEKQLNKSAMCNPPKVDSSPIQQKGTFNLKRFLDATKDTVPKNDEWKRLCVYFASQKLDPKTTCDLCNQYWGYSNRETEKFMNSITQFDVGVGSIVHYLRNHATEWDEVEIFGTVTPKELFFNELEKFYVVKGKKWELKEIHEALLNTFSYIWGDKNSLFVYKEKFRTRGGKYLQTNIVVNGIMPYSKDKLDRNVCVKATKAQLWDLLKKIKHPKTNNPQHGDAKLSQLFYKAKTLLQKGFSKVTSKSILQVLGPIPAKRHAMGKIFSAYHTDGYLKQYHSYKWVPFFHTDPTSKDQLNCFTGFTLHNFRNNMDITQTNIYKWLTVAWCNREPRKIEWLLNYFAHKLQRPARKIKRMIVVYGTKTGTGKTTIRVFLEKLFDKTVLFVDSLKDFTGTFTGQQFGKLFCVIDDIEKWNKTSSSTLKTRITSDSYTHRVMYADPVDMPCYLDLICTANSRNPVFVGENDRRTELVVINEELKGNTEFWNKLYAELDDNTIMGGFFDFLATRDLTGVVFNENYRFSESALEAQKKMNLKSSYAFLTEYFTSDDCIFHRRIQYDHPELFQFLQFKETQKHGRHLVMSAKKFFEIFYQRWLKTSNQHISS